MRRLSAIPLAFAMVAMILSMSWAQTNAHHPSGQPQAKTAPAPAPQPMQPGQCPMPQAAPGGMMGGGGMMPGMMPGMQMMCQMPAMVVDTDAVYVMRGNDIYKFNKTDLTLLAQGVIPMPQPSAGMPMTPGSAGAGPSMTPPGAAMSPGVQACMANMPAAMQQMMSRMQNMSSHDFDKSFLWNMMRHHAGAIAMSRLAVQHAHRPELRSFAQKVMRDQSREITEFRRWLGAWYGTSMEVTPMPMDKEKVARLQQLHGSDFEVQYMQDMIKHHSQAICMGQMAEQKAEHSQLRSAASRIVSSQTGEIEQLRTWLSSWYNVTY